MRSSLLVTCALVLWTVEQELQQFISAAAIPLLRSSGVAGGMRGTL